MTDATEHRAANHLKDVYRDEEGRLWEVVGYIDQPALALRNVISGEQRVHVIGSQLLNQYTRLTPEAK